MSEAHAIRCYQYVNVPYERVRESLKGDAVGLFQRATTAAATRASALVSNLRVSVGALEVGTDAVIEVREIAEDASAPGIEAPRMRLSLEWRAAKAAGLFPQMKAVLSIYPLSSEETQLDFLGDYRPPGGVVGGAVDAIVGHRVAEATVHRFVDDIATRLRQELAKT